MVELGPRCTTERVHVGHSPPTVARACALLDQRASPRHLGGRNSTSTAPKLSKTLQSRPLILGISAISRERIAASLCDRCGRSPLSVLHASVPVQNEDCILLRFVA